MTDTPDEDALFQRFMARFQKAKPQPSADDDDDIDPGDRNTLRGRVQRLAAEKRQLTRDMEELVADAAKLREAQAARLKTIEDAKVNEIKELREQAAQEVNKLRSTFNEDLSLHDAGLRDPDGREALRRAWERQPAEARGKTPADWWKQTVEARNAAALETDPAKKAAAPAIPGTLVGYLPPPPAPVEVKPDPKAGRTRAAAPRVDREVQTGARPSALDMRPSADVGVDDFIAALRSEAGAE